MFMQGFTYVAPSILEDMDRPNPHIVRARSPRRGANFRLQQFQNSLASYGDTPNCSNQMNPTSSTSCTTIPSTSNVQRFTMNFTDISSNNSNNGQQIEIANNPQVNRSAFVPITRSNFNEEMMDVSSGLPPVQC